MMRKLLFQLSENYSGNTNFLFQWSCWSWRAEVTGLGGECLEIKTILSGSTPAGTSALRQYRLALFEYLLILLAMKIGKGKRRRDWKIRCFYVLSGSARFSLAAFVLKGGSRRLSMRKRWLPLWLFSCRRVPPREGDPLHPGALPGTGWRATRSPRQGPAVCRGLHSEGDWGYRN